MVKRKENKKYRIVLIGETYLVIDVDGTNAWIKKEAIHEGLQINDEVELDL